MREELQRAAGDPLFKLTLMFGVKNLINAARAFSSIGIDVCPLITEALKSISSQLTGAAYEMTDLNELLKDARVIGDEVGKKQLPGPVTPTKTQESDNQNQRDFGKSD